VTIRIDEAQIQRRLRSDRGLSLELEDIGREVAQRARENASGKIVNIVSGDLVAGIFVRPGVDAGGEFVEVGSSATHKGFHYPGFLDESGRPWLSQALVKTVGLSRARRAR
jgi:hypothetical protein